MICVACGHHEFSELGTLGRRHHVRCRGCGLDSSFIDDEEDADEDHDPDDDDDDDDVRGWPV